MSHPYKFTPADKKKIGEILIGLNFELDRGNSQRGLPAYRRGSLVACMKDNRVFDIMRDKNGELHRITSVGPFGGRGWHLILAMKGSSKEGGFVPRGR